MICKKRRKKSACSYRRPVALQFAVHGRFSSSNCRCLAILDEKEKLYSISFWLARKADLGEAFPPYNKKYGQISLVDPGFLSPPCPQDFFSKIMQFSGNFKWKPPIMSKFWAQPPWPKSWIRPWRRLPTQLYEARLQVILYIFLLTRQHRCRLNFNVVFFWIIWSSNINLKLANNATHPNGFFFLLTSLSFPVLVLVSATNYRFATGPRVLEKTKTIEEHLPVVGVS